MDNDCWHAANRIAQDPVVETVPWQCADTFQEAVRQIADSIQRFGFTNPVLISDDDEIIAGHGRVMAAKELGLATVPTLKLSHLSPAERRAYVLADNKLALNAGWDHEILAIELQALIDLDFDVSLTGFSLAEVDLVLDEADESSPEEVAPADVVPEPPASPGLAPRRPVAARPASAALRRCSQSLPTTGFCLATRRPT